jgi:serine/threonine protein phosphatase 1
MKYYVTADTHGFYTELMEALNEVGFFTDSEPHKLIICGDLFDRGAEALKLQNFILELMKKNEVILIKGNHEDLMLELVKGWDRFSYMQPFHEANGTLDTVLQLTQSTRDDLEYRPQVVAARIKESPFLNEIMPLMVNYYNTEHYIFVHGWIPCSTIRLGTYTTEYSPIRDWEYANDRLWSRARWLNGMEAAHNGIIEPGKIIACGHWHSSFGHANYENSGGEFDNNPDFSPYYGDGIIALDACTAFSRKVNCIVIED